MAATITRNLCKFFQQTNAVIHLQTPCVSHSSLLKAQNADIVKDVYRTSWYRSFFGSDPTKADAEKKKDSFPDKFSKPKRPPNVFLMYLQNVQDGIKSRNPGFSRQDIVTEAAKRWKELDPEEKSILAMERKELYDKYKEDIMNYIGNMTPEQITIEEKQKEKAAMKKLKKARRQLGMPERPWSSYKWFLSEKFEDRTDQSVQDFFKIVKDKWVDLPEKEKEIYYKKHLQSKDQYEKEMAAWEESMMEEGRFDLIRKSTLNKMKVADNAKERKKRK